MTRRTLGDVSRGRDNTFDFLRFCFASLVIFSHSFALLFNGTREAYDPLLRWTNGQAAFGGIAVDGFFLLSGFLITQSWQQSKNAADYAKKRLRRILPALVAVLFFTVLIAGPLATELPWESYFHSPRTWAYFGFLGTLNLHRTDRLPGVFAHSPLPWRVNGSLWTIRCEAICYLLVMLLGRLGVYRRPAALLLVSVASVATMALGAKHLMALGEFADTFRVGVFFFWGMTFYLYRARIPHTPVLLLAALAGLVLSSLFGILACTLPVLGAYALFYVGFRPRLGLQRFAKHGDFSYGLYLYAFPMQQLLVAHFRHGWNAGTLTLASFTAAGACAVLSWHLIEKRWLRRKLVLKDKYETPILQPAPAVEGARRLQSDC